jgi:DNA-binding SARP family transcriptional activator
MLIRRSPHHDIAGNKQLMELSAPLVLGVGHLAGAALIGRLPGIAVFGAGLIAGALGVALTGWLAGRSPHDQAEAVQELATPAGQRAAPEAPKLMPGKAACCPGPDARDHRRPGPIASSAEGSGVVAGQDLDRSCHAPSLRICMLGSLTVNGQAGALVPAQSQLIVALALNRNGLSNRQLRRLLGADAGHPRPADSLRQLIARTRRALGRASDGREWIEHLGHGTYALHPDARMDCHAFEALTSAGIASDDAGPLAEALDLVRGRPFTGCYYWWLEPAIVESVTARIVATAEALARLRLAGGDPAAAVRAARVGLAADASAEQLWRIVMRAEHAAGNLAGVRGAWGRCLDVVSEVAADGQPDSATSAVYSELLAR